MRFLHMIYANLFGYFWKPCPICGKMFGGHEIKHMYGIMNSENIAKVVCNNPDCIHDSAIINIANGHRDYMTLKGKAFIK